MKNMVTNQKNLIKQILGGLFENDTLSFKQILNNLDECTLEEYGFLNAKMTIDKIFLKATDQENK